MTKNDLHPFEKAGLGKAPFRYVGQVAQDICCGERLLSSRDSAVRFTTKPGGTCDACGTYIVNMFRIMSADGQESVVGSDCILKVSQSVQGRKAFDADLKKVQKAARQATADRKKAKDKLRVQAAIERLPFCRGVLGDMPHPYQSLASQGKTMLDYVRWMFDNAGLSGQVQAARIVEQALEG
jgi:hypothetical protein